MQDEEEDLVTFVEARRKQQRQEEEDEEGVDSLEDTVTLSALRRYLPAFWEWVSSSRQRAEKQKPSARSWAFAVAFVICCGVGS